MDHQEELMRILPRRVREALTAGRAVRFIDWREIRLRVGQQAILVTGKADRDCVLPVRVTEADVRECLQAAAHYSLYAYEDELRQGFLTVRGGHRIGVAGRVTLAEGRVRAMKQVSSLNIRVAHAVQGCAEELLEPLFGDGIRRNVLLIAPPGAGKTTQLRDLVRLLSSGASQLGALNVGVVDERSELAACDQGVPQHDLGPRADVLDGCPKAEGIYMLLRSMAPDVIAVDEISLPEDARALAYAAGCGCHFLATMHGLGVEAMNRPAMRELRDGRVFDRYVVLGAFPESRAIIFDARCVCIREEKCATIFP